jgi:hypothetical protein
MNTLGNADGPVHASIYCATHPSKMLLRFDFVWWMNMDLAVHVLGNRLIRQPSTRKTRKCRPERRLSVLVQVVSENLRAAPEPSSGYHPSPSTTRPRLRGEPLLYRPPKRLRQTPPAICPQVLSIGEDVSNDQTTHIPLELAILSPPYLTSIEDDDKCTDLECDLFVSYCTTPHDTVAPLKPDDIDEDTLFDQYLRSPSPSPPPSPDDAASELSRATLIDAERDQSCGSTEPSTATLKSPAPEDAPESEIARDQDDPRCATNGPRIRLRVSQPKITLRLKLQDANQHGRKKKKGTKGEEAKETNASNVTMYGLGSAQLR